MGVYNGFHKGENTAAAYIDLEVAFDVWRDCVIYKLYEPDLRGSLLLYMDSFLTDSRSRNIVNGLVGDWINTKIGVPQGSVIASLIFILFVSETSRLMSCRVSFADDLTAWITHVDLTYAATNLSGELCQLTKWNKKWRLTINIPKTESTALTQHGHQNIIVKIDNRTLNQVSFKTVLGIIIYENLNFKQQVQNAANKAMASLGRISAFLADVHCASTEVSLKLTHACVRPHLEFGYQYGV